MKLQGDQIDIFGKTEPVAVVSERVENDFYPTPWQITEALLNRVDVFGAVLEPCAGNGAISDLLEERDGVDVWATDLTYRQLVPRDATTQKFWDHWGKHDWVITNPPFNCAAEILAHAWKHSTVGCAFLLRLSFLEPTNQRADQLKALADSMTHLIPVSPRPKFRRDKSGSDSVTCAWFVWDHRWSWEENGIDCPFQFLAGWR